MAAHTSSQKTTLNWAHRAYWILKMTGDEGCTLNSASLAERINKRYATWHSEFGRILGLVAPTDPNLAASDQQGQRAPLAAVLRRY